MVEVGDITPDDVAATRRVVDGMAGAIQTAVLAEPEPEPRTGEELARALETGAYLVRVGQSPEPLSLSPVEVERLEAHHRERLERVREAHRADVLAIGERLLEEAESHGWCSEFDRVVRELNAELTVELPVREREYDVTVTYRFRVTVPADTDVEEYVAENGGPHAFDSLPAYDWEEA